MREYVVALHAGIDYDQFWTEIENTTSGLPHIPDRAVSIVKNLSGFKRLCTYLLTDEEAVAIKNDPRVYAIELPIEDRDDITIRHSVNYTKPTALTDDYVNWGLIRHSNKTNVYGTGKTTNLDYSFTTNGSGVDIVIIDSGIQADHPEFYFVGNTATRANTSWDWGGAVTNTTTFYKDYDGHGTHTAGIAAGKTYGWAKGSSIYSIKLTGLQGAGDPDSGLDILTAGDRLLVWHQNKHGTRPTVVNASFTFPYQANGKLIKSTNGFTVANVRYRGSTIASPGWSATYGLNGGRNTGILTNAEGAYDAAFDEFRDAGIVWVQAAGNEGTKIASHSADTASDYNNYVYVTDSSNSTTYGPFYYMRGTIGVQANTITVGALDSITFSGTDKKADYSNAGPGVDIYTAGSLIVSATSTTNVLASEGYVASTYTPNATFKRAALSGTSMAAPQVAGIVALYLQTLPTANVAQVKTWLLDNATNTVRSTGLDDDYTDSTSILGSNALVAYAPFSAPSAPPITYPVTATGNSPIIVSVVPTGRRQVLQVPPGVQSTCTMYLWGGGGAGGGGTVGGTGASGNAIKFTVSLQAGDQIDVSVGGKGFANGAPGYGHIEGADNYGGGTGGTASGTGTNGGGGGGATVVALSRAATTTQYAVTYVSDAYRESKSNTLTAWVEGINLSSATLSNTAITAMKSAVNYSTVSLYMDVMAVRTLSNVVNAFIDTVSGQINSYISSFPTDSSVYLCRGSTKIFGNNISFWDGTKQYTRTGTATPARFDATLTFTERASFISGMRATAGSTYSSASSAARSGMDAIFISVTDNILAPKLSAMACSVSLYNFTAITYVNRTTIAVAAGGAGGGGGESAGNSAKQGKNAGNSPSTNSNGYTGANGQSRASGSGGGGGGGGGGWYGGNGGAGSGGDTAGYAGESGASYNNPGYTTQATKYVGSQRVPQKINNFDVGEYATGGLANANGTDGYAVIVFTATTLPFVKDPALGWKQSTAAYVKAAGTWYPIVQVWTKVGTQWKQVAGGNSASLQFAQLPLGNGYGPGGTRNYGT